jgi:hypothetical protein
VPALRSGAPTPDPADMAAKATRLNRSTGAASAVKALRDRVSLDRRMGDVHLLGDEADVRLAVRHPETVVDVAGNLLAHGRNPVDPRCLSFGRYRVNMVNPLVDASQGPDQGSMTSQDWVHSETKTTEKATEMSRGQSWTTETRKPFKRSPISFPN